ncbi:MAG: ankyrin repeat domain-containing protein [Coxiellaceae bacterium]|nr:MAG: ankyrin repeat domain-containing protein [Coxiellaceae bacterium]
MKRNEELRDKLHTAAQTNNIREATALIQQGVSLISTSGNDANTPLHWAVINDHKEMIAMLIKSMQAKKSHFTSSTMRGKPLKT